MKESRTGGINLGAAEFEVALNGNDPYIALYILKKFVRTVHYQRSLALGSPPITSSSDHENYFSREINFFTFPSSLHEKKEDENEHINIKSLKNIHAIRNGNISILTNDPMSSNTPFVGTYMHLFPESRIVHGQWPTGLLRDCILPRTNVSNGRLGGLGELLVSSGEELFIPPYGAFHKIMLRKRNDENIENRNIKETSELKQWYNIALCELIGGCIPKFLWMRLMHLEQEFCMDRITCSNYDTDNVEEDIDIKLKSLVSLIKKKTFSYLYQILREKMSSVTPPATYIATTKVKKVKHYKEKFYTSKYDKIIKSIALKTLSFLTMTSVGMARLVANSLLDVERMGDFSLYKCFYSCRNNKITPANNEHLGEKDSVKIMINIIEPHTAAMHLASSLLESNDPIVISYISSPGNKERKEYPGILFLALRGGLSGVLYINDMILNSNDNDIVRDKSWDGDYLFAVFRLMRSIREIFLPTVDTSLQTKSINKIEKINPVFLGSSGNRALCNLFYGDALDKLARIASFAPYIGSSNQFTGINKNVCDRNKKKEKSIISMRKMVQRVSVEAVSILYTLLSDSTLSPFLLYFKSKPLSKNNFDALDDRSLLYLQQIVKCFNIILFSSPPFGSYFNGIPISKCKFILKCLNNTPQIFLPFFCSLELPKEIRTVDSCGKINVYFHFFGYLRSLMTYGPTVWDCINKRKHETGKSNNEVLHNHLKSGVDEIISCIFPKCITKSVLGRITRYSNPLLITECLKLILTFMKRIQKFFFDYDNHNNINSGEKENKFEILEMVNVKANIMNLIYKCLPDFHSLFSMYSRFNPYIINENSTGHNNYGKMFNPYFPFITTNGIICINICFLLQQYFSTFPSLSNNVSFEWSRLLPDSPIQFLSLHLSLQHCLLKVFIMFFKFNDKVFKSRKVLPVLLGVVAHAKSAVISDLARQIAIRIIRRSMRLLGPSDGKVGREFKNCLMYEASLWVDGIRYEDISLLCTLISSGEKNSVQHAIMISESWLSIFPSSTVDMRNVHFSSLLSNAFVVIVRNLYQTKNIASFVQLLSKVTIKMMLFQLNPLYLAAFINYVFERGKIIESIAGKLCFHHEKSLRQIYQFAKYLIGNNMKKTIYQMHSVTKSLFGRSHFHTTISFMFRNVDSVINVQCYLKTFTQINSRYDDNVSFLAIRQFFLCFRLLQFTSNILERVYWKQLSNIWQAANGEMIANTMFIDMDKSDINNRLTHIMPFFITSLSHTIPSNTWKILEPIIYCIERRSPFTINFLSDSFHIDNRSFLKQELRIDLMVASVAIKRFSKNHIVSLLKNLLVSDTARNPKSNEFIYNYLLHSFMLNVFTCDIVKYRKLYLHAHFPISEIFRFWTCLLECYIVGQENEVIVQLITYFENMIFNVLTLSVKNIDRPSSFFISTCDLVLKPDYIVDIYFKYYNLRRDIGQSKDFLIALLTCDVLKFSLPIFKHVPKLEDIYYKSHTTWDKLLSTFTNKLKMCDKVCKQNLLRHMRKVSEFTIARACYLLEYGRYHLSISCKCFEFVFDALKFFINELYIDQKDFDIIFVKFAYYFECAKIESYKQFPRRKEMNLIKFLSGLVSKNDMSTFTFYSCVSIKKSYNLLFIYLCNKFPEYFQKILRQRVEIKVKCFELLHSIISILHIFTAIFGESEFYYEDTSLSYFMNSSLCNGILTGKGLSAFFCLRAIRLLLTLLFTWSINSCFGKDFLYPSEVHKIIVSHKNFESFLKYDHCVRFEVIRLLICCLTFAKDKISVDKHSLLTLQRGYKASLCEEDILLRRLFFLYENTVNVESFLYIHELPWGTLQHDYHGNDVESPKSCSKDIVDTNDGVDWERLIEGLDIARVRQTLSYFPLWERLKPDPVKKLQLWDEISNNVRNFQKHVHSETLKNNNRGKIILNEINLESNEHISMDDVMKKHFNGLYQESFYIDHSQTRANGRYSVAFIITLLLGVLESFAPQNLLRENHVINGRKMNSTTQSEKMEYEFEHEENKYEEKFLKIVYRLSQKGAISLALACLSCKCPEMRQSAVVVLRFFLCAVQMNKAQALISWRERPQLELILNSVQRGLAVQRAIQLTREGGKGDYKNIRDICIPMLAPVSAIFLAKSVFILTKPGCEIYPALNKFFLRLEDHHGAYLDFSSLPAFISLFCSSAEDQHQARTERKWALYLLKDGMLDEYSYKAASYRHAPELILSLLGTLANRDKSSEDEAEMLLLLEVIHTFLNHGGRVAFNHLISAVGFIAWIQRFLVNGRFRSAFPSKKLRIGFLILIQTALKVIIKNDACIYQFHIADMARHVIEMHIDTIHTVTNSERKNTFTEIFVICTCDILWLIYQVEYVHYKEYRDDKIMKIFSYSGISLHHGITILDNVKQIGNCIKKTIGALCSLPVNINESDESSALIFCKTALSYIINNENNYERNYYMPISINILRRVKVLIEIFKEMLGEDYDLIKMIICTRRIIIAHSVGYDIWIQCVSTLSNKKTVHSNVMNKFLKTLLGVKVSHHGTKGTLMV